MPREGELDIGKYLDQKWPEGEAPTINEITSAHEPAVEVQVRAEIRRKAAAWVFPSMVAITLWVLVLVTLGLCGVITVSETLMKWLLAETVVAIVGFGGSMIAWAFGGPKAKT